MPRRAAFIYDDLLSQHVLSENHPLRSARLRYTHELLESYEAFDAPNSMLVKPRLATKEEILSYHTPAYIEAVLGVSIGDPSVDLGAFNLDTGDNPAYEGMYEAAAWSTGASLRGVELLTSGEADAVLSISGGLHHAMPGYASGFCVFNDPVIAIKKLLSQGKRVAYVDIDCHHGDGVQHAFYDTDAVLTISVHESGAFLFPGTGFVHENGAGTGRGHSVNLPLYPYTTDDVYSWAFGEIVPPLLDAFRPDVLVTQVGIDTHFRDPITHLALTVQGYGRIVAEFPRFAPKWLALGGGGYDLQAVARGWTLAYGIMSEQRFQDKIPAAYNQRYGVSTLSDADGLLVADSARKDARAFAEKSVQDIRRLDFSAHGLKST